MTTDEILVVAGIAVAVLVVLGLVLWLVSASRNRRQRKLRQRYGREYDATVEAKGRRAGVDDLDHREEERQSVRLREPDESTRADLRQRMAELQFRFVEEPSEVLLETQRVVVDSLRARGYPIAEDREQALRVLSVDHPDETPALRTLLEGTYGRDVGRMRELFVEARRALLNVLDVSYSQRDVPGTHRGPAPSGPPERHEVPEPPVERSRGDDPRGDDSRGRREMPPPRDELPPPGDRQRHDDLPPRGERVREPGGASRAPREREPDRRR